MSATTLDDLKSMMYELTDFWVLFGKYLDEVRRLQKRDETIIVTWLDDTLFSRQDLFEAEPLLANADSEEERNKFSQYHIGIPKILQEHYTGKDFPQDIVSQMQPGRDFILTTGFENFQKQKADILWLWDFSMRVSAHHDDKILNCIQHVLYELKFLPKEIVVYDNNVEDFITYHELIEAILDCDLIIMKVEMDGNKWYKKIEKMKKEED